MLNDPKVYTFELEDREGVRRKKFLAPSQQIAWMMAAGYVACHTLNPAVIGIRLVKEDRVVITAIEKDEISETEALRVTRL